MISESTDLEQLKKNLLAQAWMACVRCNTPLICEIFGSSPLPRLVDACRCPFCTTDYVPGGERIFE